MKTEEEQYYDAEHPRSTRRNDIIILYTVLYFVTILGMVYQYIIYTGLPRYLDYNEINLIIDKMILPMGYVVNALLILIMGYSGIEGSFSALETLRMPKGSMIELPRYKQIILFLVVISWLLLAVIAAFMQMYIDTDIKVNFYVQEIYTGIPFVVGVYVVATRSSKLTSGFTILKDEPAIERKTNSSEKKFATTDGYANNK